MITGDAAYIKKLNRSLIISKIFEHGMISRADLAKITGLNKATISVQAADLLAEDLIIETQQDHKNLGRRPIMLSINQQAGFVLGIDLDKHSVTFALANISGLPVQTDTIHLDTSDYDVILGMLIKQINAYKQQCSEARYGLSGVVIGIHGIVNNDEMIYFVPQHGWHNKNLKDDLQTQTSVSIYIENNANLCSFAEKVYQHHQSENLLSISLYSGIGLGIMVNGDALKGYHGYAGEIGHMIIVPDGIPCSCGNFGCWEQYASESSFMKQLSEKQNTPELSYDAIQKLIRGQEPITCEQMKQYIKYLSIGLNNIINLYNPEILVINSELLRNYQDAVAEIKNHLTSTISHYCELRVSELGNKACVMGACAFAIKKFLNVSTICLSL
ncbi:ROK family protein [Neobacillus sp. MM2021_6]|uniref:ROK family transcriptional regulator n=1 Tax=Bacillaceae TaxID=186817 RepID=UPI001407F0DF|nr:MULTISPECIES: ROK family protein [Bacillaceae]MBO0961603.1 ROK family protein [Neobacillus sp. MM2021_6]NHC19481.1 ROK family protein [Bacillus sp. MM2020_4]